MLAGYTLVRQRRLPPVPLALLVYLGVYALAAMHGGQVTPSDGARYFARPLIAIAVAAVVVGAQQRRRVLALIVFIALIQIPVTAVQTVDVVASYGRNAASGADSVTGTFGEFQAGILSLVALAAATLVCGAWLAGASRTPAAVLVVAALLAVGVLTATRAIIPFAVIVAAGLAVGGFAYGVGRPATRKLLAPFAASLVAVPILYGATVAIYPGAFVGAISSQQTHVLGGAAAQGIGTTTGAEQEEEASGEPISGGESEAPTGPAATTATTPSPAGRPEADSSRARIYVVRAGDSLSAIAERNRTTVEELARLNRLDPSQILATGTRLKLTEETELDSGPALSYVVRAGDSLSAIAVRNGTTVEELARLNQLDPSRVLRTGTRLRLSGSSAPTPPLPPSPAVPNGGLDRDTAGWVTDGDGYWMEGGATLTHVTAEPLTGIGAGRLVTAKPNQGAWTPVSSITRGHTYLAAVWARGDGRGTLILGEDAAAAQVDFVATRHWTQYAVTWVATTSSARLGIRLDRRSDITVDGVQVGFLPPGVPNGGFEQDAAGWSTDGEGHWIVGGATLRRVPGGSPHGAGAGRLVTTAPSQGAWSSISRLTPGQTYRSSLWVRGRGAVALTVGNGSTALEAHFVASDEWTRRAVTWVASASAVRIHVRITSPRGDIGFDGVLIEPVPPGVSNGGFDEGTTGWFTDPEGYWINDGGKLTRVVADRLDRKGAGRLDAVRPGQGAWTLVGSLTVGRTYEASAWVRGRGSVALVFGDASRAASETRFEAGREWRLHAVRWAASAPAGRIYLRITSRSGEIEFDEVKLVAEARPPAEAVSPPPPASAPAPAHVPSGVELLPGRLVQLQLAVRLSTRDGLRTALLGRGFGAATLDPRYKLAQEVPLPQRTGATWIGTILTETGWLGLAAFGGLLLWLALAGRTLWRRGRARVDRSLGAALPGLAALTAAGGAFATILDVRGYSIVFWVVVGLAISALRDSDKGVGLRGASALL